MTTSDALTRRILRAAPVLLLSAFALGLALIDIGDQPFWIDETASAHKISVPWRDVARVSADLSNAPLYFHLLKGWSLLGGDGEVWLRLFSALCTALGVPLVYLLARQLDGNRAVALSVAVLFVSSPFIVRYSYEARPYALLLLVCTAGLLCALLLLKHHRASSASHRLGDGLLSAIQRRRNPDALRTDLYWLGYGGAALAAAATHHTAVLFPLLTGLFLGAAWLTDPPRHPRFLLNCLAVHVLVALAYSVLLLPLLLSSREAFLFPHVPPERIAWDLIRVHGNVHQPMMALLVFPLLAAGALRWWRARNWTPLVFAALAGAGLPALLLLLGLVHDPVFKPRLLIWTVPPVLCVAAAGAFWWRWQLGAALVILMTAINLHSVAHEYQRVKQPWDRVAAGVAALYRPGDAVLVCPDNAVNAFDYYWRAQDAATEIPFYHTDGRTLHRVDGIGRPGLGALARSRRVDDHGLSDLTAVHGRVWLVNHRKSYRCDQDAARAALAGAGVLAHPESVAVGPAPVREARARELLRRLERQWRFTLMVWRYDSP